MTMVYILVRGDEQRPQILVSAVDEQNHKQGCNIGAGQRKQNIFEKTATALHRPCGPPQAVHPAQLKTPDGTIRGGCGRGNKGTLSPRRVLSIPKVGHHFKVGKNHFHRQHQGNEDHPEKKHPEPKIKIHNGKRG